MRINKNFVKIALNENETLLINTLNGLMDIADEKNLKIINKWENDSNITYDNIEEQEIYSKLLSRGYLSESDEAEETARQELLNKLLLKHNAESEKIRDIVLVLTYGCNFDCQYCYEAQGEIRNYGVMTYEMVDKAVAVSGKSLEHISFFGGEPLLLSNMNLIKYITSKYNRFSFSAITNGYFLEEYADIFSSVKTTQIQVTLDGNEEMHDSKRYLKGGQATYKKVISGIERFLELGIPVKIRMNMNSDNYVQCIEHRDEMLIKYDEYKDLLSFEMAPIFSFHGERRQEADKMLIDSDLKNLKIERKATINSYLNTSLPITQFFALNTPMRPIVTVCRAHTNSRFFDADGDIYSCILSVGNKDMSVGKYFPEYEIKSNSILNRNISTIPKCRQCKYAFLCGGGCPLPLGADNLMQPNCKYCLTELSQKLPIIYNSKKSTAK